ncbi:hypothetical protein HK102_004998 [Quaeritorhiza haematococci]|nr:hypothetical protein HK102_004998 [Quaeritorhiza haematococci]
MTAFSATSPPTSPSKAALPTYNPRSAGSPSATRGPQPPPTSSTTSALSTLVSQIRKPRIDREKNRLLAYYLGLDVRESRSQKDDKGKGKGKGAQTSAAGTSVAPSHSQASEKRRTELGMELEADPTAASRILDLFEYEPGKLRAAEMLLFSVVGAFPIAGQSSTTSTSSPAPTPANATDLTQSTPTTAASSSRSALVNHMLQSLRFHSSRLAFMQFVEGRSPPSSRIASPSFSPSPSTPHSASDAPGLTDPSSATPMGEKDLREVDVASLPLGAGTGDRGNGFPKHSQKVNYYSNYPTPK